MKQHVGKEGVSTGKGIFIIVSILIGIYLLSFMSNALEKVGVPYLAVSIFLWLGGGVFGVYIFYKYVQSFMYTSEGQTFTVERIYSRKPRYFEKVLWREVVFFGDTETAKAKNPQAKTQNATRSQCELPTKALVYKRNGKAYMLLLQPNPEMTASIEQAIARVKQ